jgi:hypothetical protein
VAPRTLPAVATSRRVLISSRPGTRRTIRSRTNLPSREFLRRDDPFEASADWYILRAVYGPGNIFVIWARVLCTASGESTSTRVGCKSGDRGVTDDGRLPRVVQRTISLRRRSRLAGAYARREPGSMDLRGQGAAWVDRALAWRPCGLVSLVSGATCATGG